MTDRIEGQLDIFDALEKPFPQPPFKVYRSPHGASCGWCGSKNFLGGGAHRHPKDESMSIFFDYCARCHEKYGHPQTYAVTQLIVIDNRGSNE